MKQINLYNIADKRSLTYQHTYELFLGMTSGIEEKTFTEKGRFGGRELKVARFNHEGVHITVYNKLRNTQRTIYKGQQGTYNLVLKGDSKDVLGLVSKLKENFEVDTTLIKKVNTAEVSN